MNQREAWTKAVPQIRARRQAGAAPPSKYKNRKTTIDGVTFDSAKEARRWTELQMLQTAGKIARLKRQQKFELITRVTNLRGNVIDCEKWVKVVGHYIADFTYDELSLKATEFIVEDVKGLKTALYRWKAKHFEAQYGIKIRET